MSVTFPDPVAAGDVPGSGPGPRVESSERVDWANRATALLVGLFTFAIYRITLAPDVSFWDSGEFIATSHSLGIPHPPGTPLYVLMGRVFSILFHGLLHVASPAVAVNFLSAIPSALAAVFLHLCVVRVGKKMWAGGDQGAFHLPSLVAGATAALFAAFASTLWTNSIEAEVYAVSGMWAVFTAWLALLWADSEPKDERLLVVIAYLLALNIGVHLATYLAALAILPFAFLHERRLAIPISFVVVLTMSKDLQFFLLVVWVMLAPTFLFALLSTEYARRHRATLFAIHGVTMGLALYAALALQPGPVRWGLFFGGPLLAIISPWLFLPPPKDLRNPLKDLGFLLALVTVLGFTCHLYLPIRAALDPPINEADPTTWQAFWDVILRAQYRPVSVLDRQATWVYQFDHMFWRYFREQWQPGFLWLVGVPGIVAHARRDRRTFLLFALLFLWTSAALVLKMNFTDHEVRERDYFFAPGFFWYAAWMGLGLGWLVRAVVSGVGGPLRVPAAALAASLAIITSAWPIRTSWETHDRRGNWVAYDYARNMLVALDNDAILFTNGDNDTFPLWYLQEVEKFRTDVRVVNLSLLNTPWYALQLKNQRPHGSLTVPISLDDAQIGELRPFRDPDGEVYLVKDQLAMDIVNTNYRAGNPRPIYFAVTVDDMMDLEPYLKLEGLVFRLVPDAPEGEEGSDGDATDVPQGRSAEIAANVNLALTRRNLEEVYAYRGLLTADGGLDSTVYRDDNETKLVTNYAAAWARMAFAYRAKGDSEKALECYERAVSIVPHYDPIVSMMGGLMMEAGREEEARQFFLDRVRSRPDDINAFWGLGTLAARAEQWEEALDWYLRGIRVDPASRDMLAGMYQSYMRLGRYAEAEQVLVRWLQLHPDDRSAKSALEDTRRLRQGGPADGPAPPSGG